jgi:hypothetical protein
MCHPAGAAFWLGAAPTVCGKLHRETVTVWVVAPQTPAVTAQR